MAQSLSLAFLRWIVSAPDTSDFTHSLWIDCVIACDSLILPRAVVRLFPTRHANIRHTLVTPGLIPGVRSSDSAPSRNGTAWMLGINPGKTTVYGTWRRRFEGGRPSLSSRRKPGSSLGPLRHWQKLRWIPAFAGMTKTKAAEIGAQPSC